MNELELLNIQVGNCILNIWASILLYIATVEGIQLIYSKYDENIEGPNPDGAALDSAYLYVVVAIVFAEIGFKRYDYLYKDKMDGGLNQSLKGEENINIGNVFLILGYIYTLFGEQIIVKRNNDTPIEI